MKNNLTMGLANYSNMIGYDEDPTLQRVRNWNVQERVTLEWDKNWGRVFASVKYDWNKTSSYSLSPVNSNYGEYGFRAGFNAKLPHNFSIYSIYELSKYYGYIDNPMNRSISSWNAEISYTMLKGALRLSIKGEDMLNQMNGLSMAVDANGRTQTDRLTLGRVILFKVAYKFHRKPRSDKK